MSNPTDAAWKQLCADQTSRKELFQRYRQLNDLATAALNKFCYEQVRQFVVPIVQRCADAVDAEANDKAGRDAGEAAELGTPYVESETVCALRTKARSLRSTASAIEAVAHSQGSPRQVMRDVGIEL